MAALGLPLILAAAAAVLSALGVALAIRIGRRAGVMDVPNARSSHTVATPRTGGVPVAAAAAVAFGTWCLLGGGGGAAAAVLLFALSMAALGFLDDLRSLSPFLRLLVQLAAACVLLLAAFPPPLPVPPLFGIPLPREAWIAGGGLLAAWLLNLYNFMDGIDGLAGGEAVVSGLFLSAVFFLRGEPSFAAANLFVAAAAAGFLVHNRPPASVFLGDGGSAFLGAFFGGQAVVAAGRTDVPLAVLLLPLSNFVLDASATLLRRLLARERWWEAHRSHYYQRLAASGWSHGKVTALELLAAVASCGGAAAYLVSGPGGRILSVLSVLVAFLALAAFVRRVERGSGGRPGRRVGGGAGAPPA